jgi:hypothetical protein
MTQQYRPRAKYVSGPDSSPLTIADRAFSIRYATPSFRQSGSSGFGGTEVVGPRPVEAREGDPYFGQPSGENRRPWAYRGCISRGPCFGGRHCEV